MEATLLRYGLMALLIVAPLHAISAERNVDFVIAKRRVAVPPPTFAVVRGDIAVLRWTSDEAVTIHLHGYDVALALAPGKGATMRVPATAAGRFPITSHGFGGAAKHGGHHREQPLAFLEVRPE
jgi:hypothetical protein